MLCVLIQLSFRDWEHSDSSAFKESYLNVVLGTLIGVSLPEQGLEQMDPRVPGNLSHAVILLKVFQLTTATDGDKLYLCTDSSPEVWLWFKTSVHDVIRQHMFISAHILCLLSLHLNALYNILIFDIVNESSDFNHCLNYCLLW